MYRWVKLIFQIESLSCWLSERNKSCISLCSIWSTFDIRRVWNRRDSTLKECIRTLAIPFFFQHCNRFVEIGLPMLGFGSDFGSSIIVVHGLTLAFNLWRHCCVGWWVRRLNVGAILACKLWLFCNRAALAFIVGNFIWLGPLEYKVWAFGCPLILISLLCKSLNWECWVLTLDC